MKLSADLNNAKTREPDSAHQKTTSVNISSNDLAMISTNATQSSRLFIIVPIYKNAPLVRACVDSLLLHLPEVSSSEPHIILINDSPDDPDVCTLIDSYARDSKSITAHKNESNLGFLKTANRGLSIAQAAGADALLVNADTITFANTLKNLLVAADSDPQIGFACPRSNNASISSLPHFFGATPPTVAQAHERWNLLHKLMPSFQFAPTAVGFFMLIKNRVLANHGGFNEAFHLGYEEENDLVMRAGKVGDRAILVNNAFAYHVGSASFNLLDFNLAAYRLDNLHKITERHPEFLTLVRRYEASAIYRAENLLSGLLRDPHERLKIVFDLRAMAQHHNGTNEQAVAVLSSICRRHGHRIRITAIATQESFEFHKLDRVSNLYRAEENAPGFHAIAIRLGQPFDIDHVNMLESIALINIFAMLDTIVEDCGNLAATSNAPALWDHVASHANGLIFISEYSKRTFVTRHKLSHTTKTFTHLLPTRLSEYHKRSTSQAAEHILILGNAFTHKGSEQALDALASAFPTLKFICLGSGSSRWRNSEVYQSGQISQPKMEELFTAASVVVLPSYIEGFGLGFMHALAAGKPIVARRIPATVEILSTLSDVKGVHLYNCNQDFLRVFSEALTSEHSSANDAKGTTWDLWSDAVVKFCLELADSPETLNIAAARIRAGDLLRKANEWDSQHARDPRAQSAEESAPTRHASRLTLDALLKIDSRDFVESAYQTLLSRSPDPTGLTAYTSKLASGASKLSILSEIACSREGREKNTYLDGLIEAMASVQVCEVCVTEQTSSIRKLVKFLWPPRRKALQ
jgi:GT2 family glycosyltransferase